MDAELFCIEDIINDKLALIAGNTQETIKANLDGIYQRLEVLEDGLKKLSHLESENELLRQKLETLEQQIALVGELPSEQHSGATRRNYQSNSVASELKRAIAIGQPSLMNY